MSTLLLSSDTPEEGSDLITDGCEPPCGCWDLNSGSSGEQSVFLTAEPYLSTCFLPPRVLINKKREDMYRATLGQSCTGSEFDFGQG